MKPSIVATESLTLLDSTIEIFCRIIGYIIWPKNLAARVYRHGSARSFTSSASYALIPTVVGIALCSWHSNTIARLLHRFAKDGRMSVLRTADVDWRGLWIDSTMYLFAVLIMTAFALYSQFICPRYVRNRVRALFNISFGISVGRTIVLGFVFVWFADHVAVSMNMESAVRVLGVMYVICYTLIAAGAIHLHAAYLKKIAPTLREGRFGQLARLRCVLLILVVAPVFLAVSPFARTSPSIVSAHSVGQMTFRVHDKDYAEVDLLFRREDTGSEPIHLVLNDGTLNAKLSEAGYEEAELTGQLFDGDRAVSAIELKPEPILLTYRVPLASFREAETFITCYSSQGGRTIVEKKYVPTSPDRAIADLQSVNDQMLNLDAYVARGDDDRQSVAVNVSLHKQARFAGL